MGSSSLKWVKGHNGQRRKLARAVARIVWLHEDYDTTFNELWKVIEPVYYTGWLFQKRGMLGAELFEKALDIIDEVAGREIDRQIRADSDARSI